MPYSTVTGTQSLKSCLGCFASWSVSQQMHSLGTGALYLSLFCSL